MSPDLLNGIFECIGGVFILQSIFKLRKDKMVRGVHWTPVLFFASWGYWNLYYYPHLDQWLSLFGSIATTTTNTYWLGQILYYTRKEKCQVK